MQKPVPFLMFTGKAEEALNLYVQVFPNTAITHIIRYKANEAGPEGTVMKAGFNLNGQEYMCIDSPAVHAFTFTPSISFYVFCDSEEEIDRISKELGAGGSIFMPLGSYPFSKKFCWLSDRFGISWQLSLK